MERIILHSDLNNFYASVECLHHPELAGLPVAVCGDESLRHGIVLAKNHIAKKFGVITAEPIWQAKQKCPRLVTVKPNFPLYLKYSNMAREIYLRYTNIVEPFGIDECWLDVTKSTKLFGSGVDIANRIRQTIKSELGITVSIGVSFNKIFAKLGSDLKKPDAVTVITKEDFRQIVWPLPIKSLLYVGKTTSKKLNNIGVYTIGDLANLAPTFIQKALGKCGETLWLYANGLDQTPVSPNDFETIAKGISNSITTQNDLTNNEYVQTIFYMLAESIAHRLRKQNLKGATVQIFIRDNQFNSIERQAKLTTSSYISNEIAKKAMEIFLDNWKWKKPIRALGIRVTDLATADGCTQLSMLDDSKKRLKLESLESSIDLIREKFGHYSVQRASLLKKQKPSSLNHSNPQKK